MARDYGVVETSTRLKYFLQRLSFLCLGKKIQLGLYEIS